MFEQVVESSRNYDVKIRVDANEDGLNAAIHMSKWLADRSDLH